MLLHADLLNCGDYFIELILWLLGAFLLGYALSWIIGAKHRDRVVELEKDLETLQTKATNLEVEMNDAKYERDKTAEELALCKRKRDDLFMKLKVCEEKLNQKDMED